jgi:uncharacterized protein
VTNSLGKASDKITGDTQILKKEIIFYIVLSSLFSWSVMFFVWPKITPNFQYGNIKAVEELFGSTTMMYGFGPFLSAIAVTLIFREKKDLKALFRRVIEWRVSYKWYLVALFFPFILQALGLLIWSYATETSIAWPSIGSYLSSWFQITIVATVYYISEELGWRGFLQPRFLSFKNVLRSTLILGVIWSIWHYPIWITSAWLISGSWAETIMTLLSNTFYAIGVTFFITWIFRNTTGSVLLAMIFHGAAQAGLIKIYSLAGDSAVKEPFLILTFAAVFVLAALVLIRVTASEWNHSRENTPPPHP